MGGCGSRVVLEDGAGHGGSRLVQLGGLWLVIRALPVQAPNRSGSPALWPGHMVSRPLRSTNPVRYMQVLGHGLNK